MVTGFQVEIKERDMHGLREMTQWLKHLSCKHKDQSLDPQYQHQSWVGVVTSL